MTYGYFRDRADIQPDTSAAGADAPEYTTSFVEDWPCEIEHVSGNESLRGRQLEANVRYSAKGHWITGVKETMRLSVTAGIYAGRYLNIEAVEPVVQNGRPVFLRLLCSETPVP